MTIISWQVVELRFNGTFGDDYCKLFLNNIFLYVIRLEQSFSVVPFCMTSYGYLFLNGGSMRV